MTVFTVDGVALGSLVSGIKVNLEHVCRYHENARGYTQCDILRERYTVEVTFIPMSEEDSAALLNRLLKSVSHNVTFNDPYTRTEKTILAFAPNSEVEVYSYTGDARYKAFTITFTEQ